MSDRVPRLMLEAARWRATCGRCGARSRVVSAMTARAAWNETASTEGWCSYEEHGEHEAMCLPFVDAELSLAERAKRGA